MSQKVLAKTVHSPSRIANTVSVIAGISTPVLCGYKFATFSCGKLPARQEILLITFNLTSFYILCPFDPVFFDS